MYVCMYVSIYSHGVCAHVCILLYMLISVLSVLTHVDVCYMCSHRCVLGLMYMWSVCAPVCGCLLCMLMYQYDILRKAAYERLMRERVYSLRLEDPVHY